MQGFLLVIAVLLVVGFVVWLVESAPFVSDALKPVIRWCAIAIGGLFAIKLLLEMFGINLFGKG